MYNNSQLYLQAISRNQIEYGVCSCITKVNNKESVIFFEEDEFYFVFEVHRMKAALKMKSFSISHDICFT